MKKTFQQALCVRTCLFHLLFFLGFVLPTVSSAQVNENNRKLSPILLVKTPQVEKQSLFFVVAKDPEKFKTIINTNTRSFNLVYLYEHTNTFLVQMKWSTVVQHLLPDPNIIFIDEQRKPMEELVVGNYDLGTNKISPVHAKFPQWNGVGIGISIKEQKMDTADIDLKGRYVPTPVAAPNVTAHATIMATIAAGGGNSFFQGKGVAWASSISSSTFQVLLPDQDNMYNQYGISVQNHSYGTGIENFYGADAAAYDASTISNPGLLHIFSAGNAGNLTSNAGPYNGVQGFANTTGSFKMAKNIITVGHTDSFGTVLPLSSRGPAYDGRVKPELVAFGEDGSSGATALVSGISALLQDAYRDLHGTLPSSELVKAVLLNSADDIGPAGIDFTSGYGSANAYKSLETIVRGNYFSESIAQSGLKVFDLNIPAGIRRIKISLVWNDPPANPNVTKALVNDLDLSLDNIVTAEQWQPWVLDPAPHIDSLQKLPQRKKDSLNNVEQITVEDPVPGLYQVRVNGYAVTSTAQPFFIAYQLDTADTFNWYYPSAADNITGDELNTLRWASNFSNANGRLEFTTDGNTWQLIDATVDLSESYYKWQAPAMYSTARFRMTIGGQNFVTDTITISQPLTKKVGFNCADSFLLYWNNAPGINTYQVYNLGEKFLEPFKVTADTFIVISKTAGTSMHYATAPVINGHMGVKSRTFNYANQGVGCYIKSFLALLANNAVTLDLEIGTLYNIKLIEWQKLGSGGFHSLAEVTSISSLVLSHIDNALTKGLNSYRVRFELNDGSVIYSPVETVHYFNDGNYIVYPNPVRHGQPVTVLNKEASLSWLQVFNSTGSKVFEKLMDDSVITIPAGLLSPGIYTLRFTMNGKREEAYKLVVY